VSDVQADVIDELRTVLRRATGEVDMDFAEPPTRLTGGFWAQLFLFRLTSARPPWQGPLVARVMPDPDMAAKETVFQRAVAAQGYPTPRVHAAGGPEDGVDGQAYMVMDFARGRPLLDGLDGVRALGKLPSLARRLPATLASVLAQLHRLDPAPVVGELGAGALELPTLPVMLNHLHDTAVTVGRTDLATAAAWLAEHPTSDSDMVLCHGDMHPFNVLADDGGGVTVLDWSAAALAPGTYDLGFTSLLLAEPPLVVPDPLRRVVRRVGRALSDRFIRAYERAAGVTVDPDVLEWHQALICLRALVEVAGWVAAGTIDARGGHPWVIAGDAFAARLSARTGASVSPR
jgi:aminoglycoside phosphotransferase (APT) family kinase protein